MSVNALLEEFKVKAATPKQQLAEYKAQGKKVVGVLHNDSIPRSLKLK